MLERMLAGFSFQRGKFTRNFDGETETKCAFVWNNISSLAGGFL
jgi:hypothetical protein